MGGEKMNKNIFTVLFAALIFMGGATNVLADYRRDCPLIHLQCDEKSENQDVH